MAWTQYFVVLNQGQRKFSLNSVHHGPYSMQALAIIAVIDVAHINGKNGHDSLVLV